MKKGLDPFRVAKLVNIEESVESLACDESLPFLYVGTTQGSLLQYEVSWLGQSLDEAPSASSSASAPRRCGHLKLSSRYGVEQVRAACGFVFALTADGVLSVLPGDIQAGAAQQICREAKNFCLHTGRDQQDEGGAGPPEVCVSLRKKLVLYSYKGRGYEQRQEFPTSEPACALAWHSTWICAGFRREYSLYSDRAGVPREICHLDGKFSPQIVVVPGNELLLMIGENIGLFYNLSTQQPSPKSTVTWPRKVASIGAASNYVFGSTGNGQIDVFSVRDQKNCQTMTLEGSTLAVCAGPGGRALIASQGGAVACLDPVPFARQVQLLLLQVRVSDALDLLNANFGPEDPRRAEQLRRFHVLAGWALFNDLQFAQAFSHFTYAPGFQLAKALSFWRRLLPGGLDHPALVGAAAASAAGRDDGAPELQDLEDFVRERLRDKKQEDSAAKVSATVDIANASMASFLLRQREALLAQERLPPSERLPVAEGKSAGSGPQPVEPGAMLRAVDTVLIKIFVDTGDADGRLQRVLDAGARCTVADCEAFLRERKRFDVLAHLWKAQGLYELVLEQWSSMLLEGGPGAPSRSQIVAEMADALGSVSGSPAGAELLRRHVPLLLEADPSAVLQIFVGTNSGKAGGSAAGGRSLNPDEVLQLLSGHSDLVLGYLEHLVLKQREAEPRHRSKLGLIYLQQAADERKHTNASSSSGGNKREMVLRFLEDSEGLDARSLLPKAEELGLHEERVVLHCRELEHDRALRILVEDLNDLPRAEIYCRVSMVRLACGLASSSAVGRGTKSATVGSKGDGEGNVVDVSIFCPQAQLPAWAAPEVFRSRRGAGGDGEDADSLSTQTQTVTSAPLDGPAGILGPAATGSAAARDEAPGTAALRRAAMGLLSGSARPLMLLLQVLLDACAGAERDPQTYPKVAAEYREATLALLNGYAGHHDLPPHEVVGMLPTDWTLESLAAYLTKCTRLCVHERRAGMLEENLSSMAYLKTFDALARERMRKVTINSTDACPVCNRRFVDKDSVGKAFVAYPNETCVHLQCKEDLSVCPKTGQSFADNISVFCNALGTEPSE